MTRTGCRRRGLAAGIAVGMATALISACGGSDGSNATGVSWSVGGGAVGGTSYNISAAMGEAVRGLDGDVTLRVEETAGGPANVTRLANGALQLAFVQASEIAAASEGTNNFEEVGAVEGLRLVMAGTEGGVGFLAPSSTGIESYEDLCGKTVGTTSPGAKTNLDALLTSAGVDPNCVEWSIGATYDQMVTAFSDGTIDAGGFIGLPIKAGTATLQAAETMDINFVSADPADKAKHDKAYPYWPLIPVPAGSFPGQEKEWIIGGFYQNLYSTASVPEDEVKAVVEALVKSNDECTKIQAACAEFTLEHTAESLKSGTAIAPPHPGLEAAMNEADIDWKG